MRRAAEANRLIMLRQLTFALAVAVALVTVAPLVPE